MAGASAERQETGVIKEIAKGVKANKNNPVTVIAGKTVIRGVIKAEKYSGRQLSGSEPYTDVVMYIKTGKKITRLNLSLKGEAAPSLAGGGLRGLELAVPGIAKKFMTVAHAHLVNKTKLNPGDKVPDVYGKIGSEAKKKIVVGNAAMGGPIDYMYIGPMNVTGPYDAKKNIVTLKAKSAQYLTRAGFESGNESAIVLGRLSRAALSKIISKVSTTEEGQIQLPFTVYPISN